jgi:meso-butanediol dehydrogenase/(S,S)-butanediol dehydrogenase/diacetyl reductase
MMSVVLVTGASSGIGAAIAIAFAEQGWDVMAAGRDEARLDEVAEVSDRIVTWAGELETSEDCDDLIADTLDEFGRLDCLVNNAGVFVPADITETSDEDWRHTLTINLDVPFYLSRAAIPQLLQNEGSIINIASDWGVRGGARAVAYCASKGGLVLMTRAMARDHAADGVRINAICPGDIDTPMLTSEARAKGIDEDEYIEQAAAAIPGGRVGTPEEVAALALFLAGDAATHINGTAMLIDGAFNA